MKLFRLEHGVNTSIYPDQYTYINPKYIVQIKKGPYDRSCEMILENGKRFTIKEDLETLIKRIEDFHE